MVQYFPVITGSLTVQGNVLITGSINTTAGITGSFSGTATTALTASSVANLNQNVVVTGSLTTTGQIVAQTLNVQQVTSSIVFSSGSNVFGNSTTNTQQLTGSVSVTGSFTVATTGTELQVTNTGVRLGNVLTDVHAVTGSLLVTGSLGIGTTSPTERLSVVGSGLFGNSGIGSYSLAISNNDQSNVRFRLTNTGTGGQSFSIVGGNPGTSNSGLAIYDETNSATRLYVSSSGNVGIGTSSPVGPLTIAVPAVGSAIGASNSQQAFDYSRLRIKHYSDSNLGLSIGYAGANLTYIQACYNEGTTAPLLLNPFGGNVGIGTSNTGGLLTLAKNNNIAINTSDGSDDGYLAICGAGGDGSGRGGHIYLSGNERGADAGTAIISAGNVSGAFVGFRTGADIERMRITSAGLVGIGTSSPLSNLQINGNNATVYDASVDSGQDDGGVTLTIRNNDISTVGSFSQIDMMVSGDSGRALGRIVTIRTASATSDMAFVTERENAKAERIRITSNGVLRFSNVPFNNYQIDSSISIAIASGGTIPFETFSGLIIINNMSNGVCAMWLCGAGATSLIGQGGGGATGTLSYSVGINGYVWTAPATANYGVFAVRTRANA